MDASYFTSAVTLEVKAERSLEMGVEWSSNSKSGAGWSSDLGVGWNLEQQKWEMGRLLRTDLHRSSMWIQDIASASKGNVNIP